ncbi:hypothetical protein AR543_p0021 (plasmid) [Paenibacillus bovis]|uniref:Uncharacterized protein n=1 Tax=Paenibacillus bovis TaxID=1616788 RepID=A0A1X9T438_9BACL|nr:hypothetical protein AR543_p0021 [Paenibacillus bovis]
MCGLQLHVAQRESPRVCINIFASDLQHAAAASLVINPIIVIKLSRLALIHRLDGWEKVAFSNIFPDHGSQAAERGIGFEKGALPGCGDRLCPGFFLKFQFPDRIVQLLAKRVSQTAKPAVGFGKGAAIDLIETLADFFLLFAG